MQTKKEETKQKLNLNCKDCSKNLQKCTCMKDTIDMKQETIGEASKKLILDKWLEDDKVPNLVKWGIEIGFEKGVKWNEEQNKNRYSEEEVLNFTQIILSQYKVGNTNIEQLDLLKETLQQFKKKQNEK